MFRMLRWPAVPAMALMLGATTASMNAQVTATVVMKSGERHEGEDAWARVDKGELAMRRSSNDELRVSIGDVAYIDFGAPAGAELNLSGSEHAVLLRSGNTLRGQVIEVGRAVRGDQSSDYRVLLRDESGRERQLPLSQVARVYFANTDPAPTATTGTESGAAQGAAGIIVPARQQWTSTGLTVQAGETIRVNTTGQIQLSNDSNDIAQAAGATSQRLAPGAPLPEAPAGMLIGRVGTNGQPFAIGNQTSVQVPDAGQLFLGINDDDLSDNQGEFRVEIQRAGAPAGGR